MCEILKFPVKKEFPKEIEDQLYSIAKEYIAVLYNAMDTYVEDEDDPATYETFLNEAMIIYTKALMDAVEELDLDSD